MIKETVATGKTIEAAVNKGAAELGIEANSVKYEIIDEPKNGFLGIGAVEARVRVYYIITPAMIAVDFVKKLLNNMEIDAEIIIASQTEEEARIEINGKSEELGVLIGRHGEMLDSFQYLTSLAANKETDEFFRIGIDINGYRAKREETLRILARRMAEKAMKYGKNFTLEPMSSNERRIIHSEIQTIEGVSTYSVGQDKERKIVVTPDNKKKYQQQPKQ